MKRITGKIVKSVVFVFCMALLEQMLLPAAQVQAASRKALKAYKNYMQKQSKDSIFAVFYLDKDFCAGVDLLFAQQRDLHMEKQSDEAGVRL